MPGVHEERRPAGRRSGRAIEVRERLATVARPPLLIHRSDGDQLVGSLPGTGALLIDEQRLPYRAHRLPAPGELVLLT